ncbi:MAG: sulfur carrier protein ThiS [Oscillospiraceae bacterium]|nr:sulfur carrier protein ThiS [Oscillospiraceae bacterium]
MIVNGKPAGEFAGTLLEYLLQHGYREDCVVVERGGEIIVREQFSDVVLQRNDELNILHFMGGG